MCTTATFDVWKSLYSKDLERVYSKERPELNRAAMLLWVLDREFAEIRETIAGNMAHLRKELDTNDIPPELGENKENTVTISQSSPELFNSSVIDSTIVGKLSRHNSSNKPAANRKIKTASLKFNRDSKGSDSEFETPKKVPDNKVVKKKVASPLKLSGWRTKTSNKKELTVKDYFSLDVEHVKETDETYCPQISRKDNKKSAVDETVLDAGDCSVTPTNSGASSFKDQHYRDVSKPRSPVIHRKVTEGVLESKTKTVFPYVLDPVRKKEDKLKLKGWSCRECKEYYESLNLPPEEIAKRMNDCSRHRGKFEPLDDTPDGFWDVRMDFSEQSVMVADDSNIFGF